MYDKHHLDTHPYPSNRLAPLNGRHSLGVLESRLCASRRALKQISFPPILLWITHSYLLASPYISLSPFAYSRANKRWIKTSIPRSLRASNSFTLLHSSSGSFLLPSRWMYQAHFPEARAHPRSQSAFTDPIRTMKRLSREYAEHHLTTSDISEFPLTAVVNAIWGSITCHPAEYGTVLESSPTNFSHERLRYSPFP